MGGAESKARARSYRHHNQLAERPGPPGKPLLVPSDKRSPEPDVVTIRWEPPLDDGGAPITGYLVEHRRTGSPHWVRSAPQLVAAPELTLAGLEPGWRYQFRVSAQNAAGLSDPGELSDLLTVTLQRTAASAPFFVKELKDSVALENEKAELSVQVRGTPTPTVAWFKDGVEVFSSRSYRVVTDNEISTLVIYQAALSDEGEVKCSATNRVGYAVTRAKLIIEAPPSIRLPRQYEEGLLFEKDEVIRLKVSVAGRPVPAVSWFLNGEPVPGGGRYEAGHSERYATLRVGEARREDRGEYQVRAVNRLGEDVASFLVTVADRPMPPGTAKVVMTLGRSVTLSWTAPEDDGGCKIGNYIVEYYRVGWNMWLKAATCRQLTTTLGELIEGSEYKFRVKAENPYGVSDPSPDSDRVFIPDPKRGLLEPPENTGEDAMDIWTEDKKRPVSPSLIIEEQYGERKTKKKRGPTVPPQSASPNMRDLLVPSDKHSILSEDSMSPPATPENPPIAAKRRSKVDKIERDIEEKETARRLEEKKKVEQFKKLEEKRQNEEARKAEEAKRTEEQKREEEKKKKEVIRKIERQTPRLERDHSHGSSELMLVLLPHSRATTEERETKQSNKELFESSMALEGDVAPPMSLSAPELGSGEPPEMPRVRAAFSSTELLHERAMARFYQDMEQEEAEAGGRRASVQRRRSFGSRPRDILDKTASLQDIVSSMRSLNEGAGKKADPQPTEVEKRPATSAGIAKSERRPFTGDSMDSVLSIEDRRKTLVQQSSGEDMEYEYSSTDEEEEDEYDESILEEEGEEEIDEELEEEEEEEELSTYSKRGSLYTSESDDERFSYTLEEETYHPMNVNVKYNEDSLISAYEGRGPLILSIPPQRTEVSLASKQPEPSTSSPNTTPSTEIKLKPILKKPSGENNSKTAEIEEREKLEEPLEEPKSNTLTSPEKRFEPNFSPIMPKPILKVRDRSQERLSPAFPRKGAPVAEVEPELNLVSSRSNLDEGSDYESGGKKKQVRIEEPDEVASRIALESSEETPITTQQEISQEEKAQEEKAQEEKAQEEKAQKEKAQKEKIEQTENIQLQIEVPIKEMLQRRSPLKEIPQKETPQKETLQKDFQRKRGVSLDEELEAARVLIDHYSDIVKEYGKGRKPHKPKYLDYEALKAAAEEEEKSMPIIPDITVDEPVEPIETQPDNVEINAKEIETQQSEKREEEIQPKHKQEEPNMEIEEPKMEKEEPKREKKEFALPAVHIRDLPEEPKSNVKIEPNVPRKRDRSLDKRDWSVDRRDTSVKKRDTSVDRRDASVDSRNRSADKRDISANKRDMSVDRSDTSVNKRDTSVDRRDASVDRRDRSADKRDTSANKRDMSVDRRDASAKKRDVSVDRQETPVNRRDRSVDKRDTSTDRRDRSVVRRDKSIERRDRSIDRRDRSVDRARTILKSPTTDKRRSPSPWKTRKQKEVTWYQDDSEIARTPSPTTLRTTTPEQRVHSFFDFLMDFSLFILACWLYLFKDERLSIPVMCLMIYRQANEAFQRKMEALRDKTKRLMFWRRKM